MIGHWNGPLTTHANRVLAPGRQVEIDDPADALRLAALGYFRPSEQVHLLRALPPAAHATTDGPTGTAPQQTPPGEDGGPSRACIRRTGPERTAVSEGRPPQGVRGESLRGRRPEQVPPRQGAGEWPAPAQSDNPQPQTTPQE